MATHILMDTATILFMLLRVSIKFEKRPGTVRTAGRPGVSIPTTERPKAASAMKMASSDAWRSKTVAALSRPRAAAATRRPTAAAQVSAAALVRRPKVAVAVRRPAVATLEAAAAAVRKPGAAEAAALRRTKS
jgi:hypothetical protein